VKNSIIFVTFLLCNFEINRQSFVKPLTTQRNFAVHDMLLYNYHSSCA